MKHETFNHGFTQNAWNAAKEEARKAMIAAAQSDHGAISYSDLAYKKIKSCTLEPHDPRLARMLGDISTEEDAAGRGMLSVVVVHKTGDLKPGSGFFKLAQSLGRDVANEEKCWIDEWKKVRNAWSK